MKKRTIWLRIIIGSFKKLNFLLTKIQGHVFDRGLRQIFIKTHYLEMGK